MVTLDIPTLTLLVGVVIPLLTGLVTKLHASSGVRAVVNLGLSALAGGLASVLQFGGSIALKTLLIGIAMTWGTSLLTYYGLWKPTGVSASIQVATADLGVGGHTTLITDAGKNATGVVPLTVTLEAFHRSAFGSATLPPLNVLADDEDVLDGCDIDMAAEAVEPGTELFWALAPDGDPVKLEQYRALFNGPAA